MSFYDLLIIGAGAAGLGASEAASRLGVNHLIVEASHRIGGRGLTESIGNPLTEIKVDLGCHWLHSASINPYVKWAKKFGFEYESGASDHSHVSAAPDEGESIFFNGQWLDRSEIRDFFAYMEEFGQRVGAKGLKGEENSLWEVMEETMLDGQNWERWQLFHAYWLSLMHSNDPDQVSLLDMHRYHDTGEDWPGSFECMRDNQ